MMAFFVGYASSNAPNVTLLCIVFNVLYRMQMRQYTVYISFALHFAAKRSNAYMEYGRTDDICIAAVSATVTSAALQLLLLFSMALQQRDTYRANEDFFALF